MMECWNLHHGVAADVVASNTEEEETYKDESRRHKLPHHVPPKCRTECNHNLDVAGHLVEPVDPRQSDTLDDPDDEDGPADGSLVYQVEQVDTSLFTKEDNEVVIYI